MNNDQKIFEVFGDLESYIRYMDRLSSLEMLYLEVEKLISEKSYSHIDMQDSNGNTLLHYAMKAEAIDWAEKLLKHGSNPLIENVLGQSALYSGKTYDSYALLFERFKYRDIEQIDKSFSREFKQILYEEILSRNQYYTSIEECQEVLEEIGIYSHANLFTLMGKCLCIDDEKKGSYFLSHRFNSEDNSAFLVGVMTQSYIKMNDQMKNEIFSLDYADNADFNRAVVATLLSKNKNIVYEVINIILKQNFDLQKKTGYMKYSDKPTLEEFLLSKPISKEIYSSLKLEYNLEKKKVLNKSFKL